MHTPRGRSYHRSRAREKRRLHGRPLWPESPGCADHLLEVELLLNKKATTRPARPCTDPGLGRPVWRRHGLAARDVTAGLRGSSAWRVCTLQWDRHPPRFGSGWPGRTHRRDYRTSAGWPTLSAETVVANLSTARTRPDAPAEHPSCASIPGAGRGDADARLVRPLPPLRPSAQSYHHNSTSSHFLQKLVTLCDRASTDTDGGRHPEPLSSPRRHPRRGFIKEPSRRRP